MSQEEFSFHSYDGVGPYEHNGEKLRCFAARTCHLCIRILLEGREYVYTESTSGRIAQEAYLTVSVDVSKRQIVVIVAEELAGWKNWIGTHTRLRVWR